jgi:hypothetical protein
MHQIEVKRNLIRDLFNPSQGWKVYVDLDSMELANGGTHPEGKREVAAKCVEWFNKAGVEIGPHPTYGRVDIIAVQADSTHLIEVEGDSSRQLEQALYSALGQTILAMKTLDGVHRFGLAVPDTPQWERQLEKIPSKICDILHLKRYLVSHSAVREFLGGGTIASSEHPPVPSPQLKHPPQRCSFCVGLVYHGEDWENLSEEDKKKLSQLDKCQCSTEGGNYYEKRNITSDSSGRCHKIDEDNYAWRKADEEHFTAE